MPNASIKSSSPNMMAGVTALGVMLMALAAHPQTVSQATPAQSTPPAAAPSGTSGAAAAKTDSGDSARSDAKAAAKTGAAADTSKAATISAADRKIMNQLTQANLAEIATAKVALEKSQSAEVKNFAQKMIDDHTKSLGEIQQLAQAKGVQLPTELDAPHQKAMKKMSALSGEKFDRAYMQQAGVSDHRQTHKLLQNTQAKAKDPDLKAFARKTLPTVDSHLKTAEQMKGGSAKAGATMKGGGQSEGTGQSGAGDASGGKKAAQ